MNIPENIKQEILDYLHIEFGEDANDPSSLKIDNIKLDGIYEVQGKPTYYYKFSHDTWATVEPFGDSYMIGMTTFSPKPIFKKDLYKELHIQSSDGSYVESIELENMGDGFYCFPEFKGINISKSEKLMVLVEANISMPVTQVVLSIKEGNQNIYLKGSIGFQFSYRTKNDTTLFFTFGTGSWE
jgi:hypothetical protein